MGAFPSYGHAKQFRSIQNKLGLVATVCEDDAVIINSGGWKLKASDFISKGYRPIRIGIENKSDILISVSDHSIQDNSISMTQLADNFKHNTLEVTIISLLLSNIMMAFMKTSATTWIGINTAVLLGYYQWQNENNSLYAALSGGLGEGSMIIRQNAQTERIFLVPVGLRGAFTFSIFDEDNKTIVSKFYVECV